MHPQSPAQCWLRSSSRQEKDKKLSVMKALAVCLVGWLTGWVVGWMAGWFLMQPVSPAPCSPVQSSEHCPISSGLNRETTGISQISLVLVEGPDTSLSLASLSPFLGWFYTALENPVWVPLHPRNRLCGHTPPLAFLFCLTAT